MSDKEENQANDLKETSISENGYVSDDPIILDAFNDVKSAILARRTDIVRQILSAAQSLREEDEYDSDGEEKNKKEVRDKYDRGDYLDLLALLMLHKDTDSGTLLHYATRIDSPDIVRAILAAGANCTVKNTEDLNAFQYCNSDQLKNVYIGELMQAVSQSRLYRIEQLLSAGIDINSCDGAASNNSVLHWAVSFSDLPTVQLVIEKGADINARNANGETPLHDAIKRGDYEIIKEVLQHGASIHSQPVKGSYEGKSPYMLVKNKPELVSLFQEYVKDVEQLQKTSEHPISDAEPLTNGDASPAERRTSSKSQPLVGLVTSVEIDRSLKYLCPPPRVLKQFEGLFFVPPTELAVQIVVKRELLVQTKNVLDLFSPKLQDLGVKVVYDFQSCACSTSSLTGSYMQCIINENRFSHKQEYKLQFCTNKILLLSSCLSSFYYGLSTFLQVLKIYRGKAVPLVQISDWPNHMNRSILLDFQENDAPKMEILCELADMLSLHKVNQIQINVQNVDRNGEKFLLNSSEFFEFQTFCKQRFIEVSPYLKASSDASFIRRNGGREEIVQDELDRLINPFIFTKSLHISLDDGELIYQDLLKFCFNRDIHLQFTTEHPLDVHLEQVMNLMNLFTVSFRCQNENTLKDHLEYPTNLGLSYNICIDDSNANNRICPDHTDFIKNVYNIATSLPENDCNGFTIIYGKKSRQINNLSVMLPGLLITSSMCWNVPKEMDDDYINCVTNILIYEDDHDVIASRVIGLGRAIPASMVDDIIQKCSTAVTSVTNEQIQEFCKQTKVLKTDLEKMKLRLRLSQFVYDELALLTEILFFLSRLCYGVLNIKSSPMEIKNLSQVHKSDHSNRLMSLIKQYDSFLNKYYTHPTKSSYIGILLLQNILKHVLPSNAQISAPNIAGVFTI